MLKIIKFTEFEKFREDIDSLSFFKFTFQEKMMEALANQIKLLQEQMVAVN